MRINGTIIRQKSALPKPSWLKIRAAANDKFSRIKKLQQANSLHTVCQEAHCPNMAECWSGGTATFMILGDTCTRACRFCMIKSGNPKKFIDKDEPKKLAVTIKKMDLKYVVLTCVTRDDLPDGGARHFANCITAVKKSNPKILVEVLISDLNGNVDALKTIIDAKPDVLAHNVETVERLQSAVRDPRANYQKSLNVLKNAKKIAASITETKTAAPPASASKAKIYTKSSLMVGLGETPGEIEKTMKDLRAVKTDILTIGQYLQPSPYHYPVHEYVTPEQFNKYEKLAKKQGFLYCASGPFVRSSYKAGELFIKHHVFGQIRPAQRTNGSDSGRARQPE